MQVIKCCIAVVSEVHHSDLDLPSEPSDNNF